MVEKVYFVEIHPFIAGAGTSSAFASTLAAVDGASLLPPQPVVVPTDSAIYTSSGLLPVAMMIAYGFAQWVSGFASSMFHPVPSSATHEFGPQIGVLETGGSLFVYAVATTDTEVELPVFQGFQYVTDRDIFSELNILVLPDSSVFDPPPLTLELRLEEKVALSGTADIFLRMSNDIESDKLFVLTASLGS